MATNLGMWIEQAVGSLNYLESIKRPEDTWINTVTSGFYALKKVNPRAILEMYMVKALAVKDIIRNRDEVGLEDHLKFDLKYSDDFMARVRDWKGTLSEPVKKNLWKFHKNLIYLGEMAMDDCL